jgi:hypothetical protein
VRESLAAEVAALTGLLGGAPATTPTGLPAAVRAALLDDEIAAVRGPAPDAWVVEAEVTLAAPPAAAAAAGGAWLRLRLAVPWVADEAGGGGGGGTAGEGEEAGEPVPLFDSRDAAYSHPLGRSARTLFQVLAQGHRMPHAACRMAHGTRPAGPSPASRRSSSPSPLRPATRPRRTRCCRQPFRRRGASRGRAPRCARCSWPGATPWRGWPRPVPAGQAV